MVTAIAMMLFGVAHAQMASDWTDFGSVLLTGADVPFGSTIGNPSVVYDANADRYFMFFETFQQSTANCPAGEWSIGSATSTDGLSWSVQSTPIVDGDPAATPSPTFYSCVAAHPGAIYVSNANGGDLGGTIYVYFKAEQASDACSVHATTPSWGCTQYTGIGLYRVNFRANGTVRNSGIAAAPVVNINTNFGYPHPMRFNNTRVLAYTRYPDVRVATSGSSYETGWVKRGSVLAPADYAVSWMEDEFFNPAVACRDTGALPLEMFVGGRDTNFGVVIDGGIGKAIAASSSPSTWTLGTDPQFTWMGDAGFRHWDVLRVSASDYLMYYDQKDGSGNNEVRLATTLPSFSWTNSDVYDKHCP